MHLIRVFTVTIFVSFSFLVQISAHGEDLKDITQLANQGQQAAALERINSYISNNPKDVQALFIRGVILAEQGKRDEATKAFVEITEKYPNLPEPYNNLAVLYADQGQYDKARKALETAIRTHPSYATAHENLGDIYARMASEAYDKALQLDNSNTRAMGKLSLIKDLFTSTGKPILLANKSPDSPKEAMKDATKDQTKTTVTTVNNNPIAKPNDNQKTAEQNKSIEIKTEIKTSSEAKSSATDTNKSSNDVNDANEAVKSWAKAWSAKNVDRYLASYSDSFQPPAGDTRSQWESVRRERINKPKNISVELLNLQISLDDPTHAIAKFKQSYKAGGLAMKTNKTLMLKKTGNKWLIEQELADH